MSYQEGRRLLAGPRLLISMFKTIEYALPSDTMPVMHGKIVIIPERNIPAIQGLRYRPR